MTRPDRLLASRFHDGASAKSKVRSRLVGDYRDSSELTYQSLTPTLRFFSFPLCAILFLFLNLE